MGQFREMLETDPVAQMRWTLPVTLEEMRHLRQDCTEKCLRDYVRDRLELFQDSAEIEAAVLSRSHTNP